ncbi:hypothetical protein ABW365_11995 [Enterococcus avium]
MKKSTIISRKQMINIMLIYLSGQKNYALNFSEYEHMWLAGTYDNLDFGKYYNPMKAKKNRFNIDAIYSRLSTLPYIRGKKKILEILVMYYWHNQISPIEEELYKKYMKQVCESI